jgi:hypothetical protein
MAIKRQTWFALDVSVPTQPCCQGCIFSPEIWLRDVLDDFLFIGVAISSRYACCEI